MATLQTYPWDAVAHLETKEDIAAYLEAALEDGDPSLVIAVLGDIARSQGMRNIASETGLGSEHLYKDSLSESNLEFTAVIKILQALGLRFQTVPIA